MLFSFTTLANRFKIINNARYNCYKIFSFSVFGTSFLNSCLFSFFISTISSFTGVYFRFRHGFVFQYFQTVFHVFQFIIRILQLTFCFWKRFSSFYLRILKYLKCLNRDVDKIDTLHTVALVQTSAM